MGELRWFQNIVIIKTERTHWNEENAGQVVLLRWSVLLLIFFFSYMNNLKGEEAEEEVFNQC